MSYSATSKPVVFNQKIPLFQQLNSYRCCCVKKIQQSNTYFLVFRIDANSEEESFSSSLATSEANIIDTKGCSYFLQAEHSGDLPPCEARISSLEDYTYSLTTEDYANLLSIDAEIGGNENYKYFFQPEDSGSKLEDSGNGSSFACEISPVSQGCMHSLQEGDPGNLSVKGHIKNTDDALDSKHFKLRGLKRHYDSKFQGVKNRRHHRCHRPASSAFQIRSTFAMESPAHGHSNVNETISVMTDRKLATETTDLRKRPLGCDENSSDRISRLTKSALFCH